MQEIYYVSVRMFRGLNYFSSMLRLLSGPRRLNLDRCEALALATTFERRCQSVGSLLGARNEICPSGMVAHVCSLNPIEVVFGVNRLVVADRLPLETSIAWLGTLGSLQLHLEFVEALMEASKART